MRERTFRKPTPREILLMQRIECPERITDRFILKLVNDGVFIPVGDSYRPAVRTVEDLQEKEGTFALFINRFRVSRKEADFGIKSLDDLAKIDSQKVLRRFEGWNYELTKELAEKNKIWPYTLIKTAMIFETPEKPPVGFYWIGTDKRVRATTWIRAVAGAEMQIMKQRGDFSGDVIDKKPYGRNLRVRVNSRTEEGKDYEFTLMRLPMHRIGDKRQYSDWINMSHNSSDPDASYRGGEHDKRALPIYVWSASTIFSFYDAMKFVRKHPEWKQFRINPFPIPTDREMVNFIDALRLRSFILDENGGLHLSVLNKTEIDKMIGARTILRGYDRCWHHWGRKDLGYLYAPR